MRKAPAPFHHEGDLHGPIGVAWHVDVEIDHDHDLGPHVGGYGGQQGGARLAEAKEVKALAYIREIIRS
jgi:hypothetical protein